MTCRTDSNVSFRVDDTAIVIRSSANFNIERGRGSKFGCWFSLDYRDAEELRDKLTDVLDSVGRKGD